MRIKKSLNTSLLNNYGRGIFLGGLSIRIHWVSPYLGAQCFYCRLNFFLASKITLIETFSEFLFVRLQRSECEQISDMLDQGMIRAPELGWNFMLIIPAIVVVLILGRAPLCMISRLLWHSLLSLLMSQKIAPSQSWVQNLN